MKNRMDDLENILDNNISGLHLYDLSNELTLTYVSSNLCKMTGFTRQELIKDQGYIQKIHPNDRKRYVQFLKKLSVEKEENTIEYRIVKKDKRILYIKDTIHVTKNSQGRWIGVSTLTDITEIKTENKNLQFLNETLPCGFLKCTCEKQPKITYMNEHLLEMLRLKDQKDIGIDFVELYKQSVYFMVPPEERRRFALYLKKVDHMDAPAAGELSVCRADGTTGRLFGWVVKSVNDQGEEEFQCVCMDISDRHEKKMFKEAAEYLKALMDVYNIIFEYDLKKGTVRCLYGEKSATFKWLQGIHMEMKEATVKWIESTVFEEDKEKMLDFFETMLWNHAEGNETTLRQIKYRALSSKGQLKNYTGTVIQADPKVNLFCCRDDSNSYKEEQLESENKMLRGINENMQGLVMQFSEGSAAFEITENYVTPLYASGNICEFFGYTKEEWITLMKKKNILKEFIKHSKVSYFQIKELLRTGEAEFSYFDLTSKKERQIKAICSCRAKDSREPRYIMLYNLEQKVKGEETEKGDVYIRTFGYFDVFVKGHPIAFRSEKAKELLALLVNRRGGFLSSEEAIGILWPEEPANTVTLSRYRKVALRLKNILDEYQISYIVEAVDGKRRIVNELVQCDLYDYLSGKEEYTQLFRGSYLTNYSWAEAMLGELSMEKSYEY